MNSRTELGRRLRDVRARIVESGASLIHEGNEMTAIEFLRKCATGEYRIVSSGDLNHYQIVEAQSRHLFFVDEETAFGWALLPWDLTTDKDRNREQEYIKSMVASGSRSAVVA